MLCALWYNLYKLQKHAEQYLSKDKYKCSKSVMQYRIMMFILIFFIFFCMSLTLHDKWTDKSAMVKAK